MVEANYYSAKYERHDAQYTPHVASLRRSTAEMLNVALTRSTRSCTRYYFIIFLLLLVLLLLVTLILLLLGAG